jgi:hypothetical protein
VSSLETAPIDLVMEIFCRRAGVAVRVCSRRVISVDPTMPVAHVDWRGWVTSETDDCVIYYVAKRKRDTIVTSKPTRLVSDAEINCERQILKWVFSLA